MVTATKTCKSLDENVRELYPSLVYEIANNGGDIHKCEWLEHLIREQDLEEKHSQLAAGPFQSCKN